MKLSKLLEIKEMGYESYPKAETGSHQTGYNSFGEILQIISNYCLTDNKLLLVLIKYFGLSLLSKNYDLRNFPNW